jgi:hypothetical protein
MHDPHIRVGVHARRCLVRDQTAVFRGTAPVATVHIKASGRLRWTAKVGATTMRMSSSTRSSEHTSIMASRERRSWSLMRAWGAGRSSWTPMGLCWRTRPATWRCWSARHRRLPLARWLTATQVIATGEMAYGADVEIQSLVRLPELNGMRGKVVEPQDPGSGRWGVKVSDGRRVPSAARR